MRNLQFYLNIFRNRFGVRNVIGVVMYGNLRKGGDRVSRVPGLEGAY